MENSDLERLQQAVEQKRQAAAAEHETIIGDIAHSKRVAELSRDMGPLTPDQFDVKRQEAIERERERDMHARADRWRAFVYRRGDVYGECRIGNYQVTLPGQQEAVDKLTAYVAGIQDEIANGTNVILFGTMGTGKDHLLSALARVAIFHGKSVDWWNGMDLFGRVRDRMSDDESEEGFVRMLTRPNVLYISDPLPPSGEPLTPFQMQFLSRVIDARYSRSRPIWMSVNTLGRADLEQRLGATLVDRLCHHAVTVFCNWESHRKCRA